MTTESTIISNEVQIRQLIADQQRAICAKDVDQIMSRYATEIIVFDVKPPFQTQGKVAWRQVWEECLPCFPNSFEIETRDLKITVSEDLAIAHWLFRFTGTEDHPAMQTWMRVTAVCHKNQGNWQILHEHLSIPFDPHTSQAAFTLNP
ncbi:MAG: nuclear transport factor 2 family protein [Brasilonema angustatum HA4187-MV1]|jgi:ketosteroid isomerase-like protein|nr:nuclear transport factor 2 family protein [Brasilonema angustatum HA4187-MV1]